MKMLTLQDSSRVVAAPAQERFVLLTSYSVTACYKTSYVYPCSGQRQRIFRGEFFKRILI